MAAKLSMGTAQCIGRWPAGAAMTDARRDRVWDVIENVGVCMMVTRFGGGLRARPLEARPERDANTIWFVTDVRGAKDDEIAEHAEVCLVFIDHTANAYLSLAGSATVTRDRARAAAIWKKTDDAWWSGPNDENVRVVCFVPARAELWDGPASAAVAAFEFAKARATGEKPNLGENRKATVGM
jgi:general stress protein 26